MTTTAREVIALRATLNQGLTLTEIREVNWTAVTNATTDAIDRGWTGTELARMILGNLTDRTESVGAITVHTLRDLAHIPPPRETTPTPPPAQTVLRDTLNQHPAANPRRWINAIREGNTP